MFLLSVIVLLAVCALLKIFCKLTLGRCKSPTCLVGKTALVTGGNSGIGYETAMGLAARGCRVIIADKDNCDKSKANIIHETGNTNIITKHFDLTSLNSVRQLAKEINETEERLDILINNAGTAGLGNKYTNDGLHIGMQVNHFGSFLLTHLLIDILRRSAPSRVVFVSSILAYIGNFTLSKDNLNFPEALSTNALSEAIVYSNSKLCNIITSKVLAQKLKGAGITSYSLHPGLVSTVIYEKLRGSKSSSWVERLSTILVYLTFKIFCIFFSKDAEEGAQTSLYLALDKGVENASGEFFSDCCLFTMPPKTRQSEFVKEIWSASEKYVKLLPEERL